MKDRRFWLIAGLLLAVLLMVIDIHSNGALFMQDFVANLFYR